MSNQEAVALSAHNNAVEGNNAESPYGPIMLDGVYNEKAHHYSEERRVERDLTISSIVEELGDETCNFVRVEKQLGGTKTVLIYHPNPDGKIGDGLEWVSYPSISKGNGGRFYKQVSNGKIEWHYYTLRGDILTFMTNSFMDSMMDNQYSADLKAFAKKAAKFIMDYPHEDNGSYGCYILMFLNLIKVADSKLSNAELQRIGIAISLEMKRVLDFNDKNLADRQVYMKVRDTSVRPTIQQCSKNVHYKISQIDLSAKKASFQLEELDKLAEQEIETEKLEKASKMQAILNSRFTQPALTAPNQQNKKRKIEEVDQEKNEDDEKLNKLPRIELPQNSAPPTVPSSNSLLFGNQ